MGVPGLQLLLQETEMASKSLTLVEVVGADFNCASTQVKSSDPRAGYMGFMSAYGIQNTQTIVRVTHMQYWDSQTFC